MTVSTLPAKVPDLISEQSIASIITGSVALRMNTVDQHLVEVDVEEKVEALIEEVYFFYKDN